MQVITWWRDKCNFGNMKLSEIRVFDELILERVQRRQENERKRIKLELELLQEKNQLTLDQSDVVPEPESKHERSPRRSRTPTRRSRTGGESKTSHVRKSKAISERKVSDAKKFLKRKASKFKKHRKKYSKEERRGFQCINTFLKNVSELASNKALTNIHFPVEQLCKRIPNLPKYCSQLLYAMFECMGAPALDLIREVFHKYIKYPVYAMLAISCYYNGIWGTMEITLTWVSYIGSGVYSLGKGAVSAWNTVAAGYKQLGDFFNGAIEELEKATNYTNETIFNKTNREELKKNSPFWNEILNRWNAVNLYPLDDIRKMSNYTATCAKALLKEGISKSEQCVRDGFNENIVEPMKRALLGIALETYYRISKVVDRAAIESGGTVLRFIDYIKNICEKSITLFTERVSSMRLSLPNETPSATRRRLRGAMLPDAKPIIELPVVESFDFGEEGKALVHESHVIVQVARANDVYYNAKGRYMEQHNLPSMANNLDKAIAKGEKYLLKLNKVDKTLPYIGNTKMPSTGIFSRTLSYITGAEPSTYTERLSVELVERLDTLKEFREQRDKFAGVLKSFDAYKKNPPKPTGKNQLEALNQEENILSNLKKKLEEIGSSRIVQKIMREARYLNLPFDALTSLSTQMRGTYFAICTLLKGTTDQLIGEYERTKKGKNANSPAFNSIIGVLSAVSTFTLSAPELPPAEFSPVCLM